MDTEFYNHIESIKHQLEKVNKERAIAIKALQEIEGYLFNVTTRNENVLLSYMAATKALEKLEWPKEKE